MKGLDVRRAALELLARREHSRYELVLKLVRRFGENRDVYNQEISKLAEEGLQSDRRLAESYIRSRAKKGQGPVKILKELEEKKVCDATVSDAYNECDVDFYGLAKTVAEKKFPALCAGFKSPQMKTLDVKTRARISRFLYQRGFSNDHIASLY